MSHEHDVAFAQAIGALTAEVKGLRAQVSAQATHEGQRLAAMERRLRLIEAYTSGAIPEIRQAATEWRELKQRGIGMLLGASLAAGGLGAGARELWAWLKGGG